MGFSKQDLLRQRGYSEGDFLTAFTLEFAERDKNLQFTSTNFTQVGTSNIGIDIEQLLSTFKDPHVRIHTSAANDTASETATLRLRELNSGQENARTTVTGGPSQQEASQFVEFDINAGDIVLVYEGRVSAGSGKLFTFITEFAERL